MNRGINAIRLVNVYASKLISLYMLNYAAFCIKLENDHLRYLCLILSY